MSCLSLGSLMDPSILSGQESSMNMSKWMPHDLLRIRDPWQVIAPPDSDQPDSWVPTSLTVAPFVVVRRAASPPALTPVGVRGTNRNQRWACFVRAGDVRSVTTPMDLVHRE